MKQWNTLLEWTGFLGSQVNSRVELEAYSKEWAFVVVQFHPPTTETHITDYFLNCQHSILQWTLQLDQSIPPIDIQKDGSTVTFFFEDSLQAVLAALLLNKSNRHQANIGIGSDKGYKLDYFNSVGLRQLSFALAFGQPHEIQCSTSIMEKCTLPDGIGAFQASKQLMQIARMPYWILKDYRS